MQPLGAKFLSVEINSPQECIGIIATAHDSRGILVCSVKIGNGCQVSLATITIGGFVFVPCVTPIKRAISFASIPSVTVGVIEHSVYGIALKPVEHGQILLTTNNLTLEISILQSPILAVICLSYFFFVCSLIDIVTSTINAARSSFANHFRKAVPIEVVDKELCITSPGTYVHS